MLNWLLNLFRKEKEEYVPEHIDITIYDLKAGALFDYNMESWEVISSSSYKYSGYSSKEYKIRSGKNETKFLNITDSNRLYLSLSHETNINNVDERLRNSVAQGQPLAKFTWEGEEYVLKEATKGQYSEDKYQEWASFQGWEYVNKESTKFVYVSKWEDNSIECYSGLYLKEHEISNLLGTT